MARKKSAMDEFMKQAKQLVNDVDIEKYLDSIDFDKVDVKKLKKVDFSGGLETARHGLEQLPKMRVTTEDEKSGDGFAGGVILGVILGAILALIFAPKSGAETREIVTQTVDDLKHKVAGESEDLVEQVEHNTVETMEDVNADLGDEPAIERNFG